MPDSQPGRARLLLADDHALVRAGLLRLLGEHDGVETVAEAADADEALALAARHRPDIVITDYSMPGRAGLELMRSLRDACPQARVLVLTMHRDAALAAQVLQAGASGYVCKHNAYPVLHMAIDRLLRGGRFIDPELADELIAAPQGARRAPRRALSQRELEILEMIAAGRPLKEIGYRLSISPKTVTSHKRRVMEKLGVVSTADLIRYAVSARLPHAHAAA